MFVVLEASGNSGFCFSKNFSLFLELNYRPFLAKEDAESLALVLQLSGFKLRDILKLYI